MSPQEVANAILDGAHRMQADLRSTLDITDETFDALTALAVSPSGALAVSGEPLPAVLNALAADLEDAALAARNGKGDYLGTMEDVAESLAALARKIKV